MRVITRTLQVGLLGLVTASLTTPARGATYDVRSCGDAPAGGLDDAWSFESTIPAPHIDRSQACPPSGPMSPTFPDSNSNGGLVVTDHLLQAPAQPDAEPGEYARYRLSSPAGTTITRLVATRNLGKRGDSFRLLLRDGSGTDLDADCPIPGGGDRCVIGGLGSAPVTRTVNTSALTFGFECTAYQGGVRCPTGATLHEVWAVLYGSTVTIDDPTPPTIGNVGGPLLSGATVGGTQSATLDAADATGIKELRLYVDGRRAVTATRPCDFSRARPCTDPPSASPVALDTTTVANGPHDIAVAAVDAAGTETRSTPRTVTIYNAPPPTGGGGSGGGGSSAATTTPTTPAPPPVPAEDAGASLTPALPLFTPPRTVVLRDPGITVSALHLDRSARTLRVSGTLDRAAPPSVRLRYRATTGRRTLETTATVRVTRGRWSITLKLGPTLARTKHGRLTVAFAGDATFRRCSLTRVL